MLINYTPKVALSNLVNSLKGVSSRMMRKEFGDFRPWPKRRGVLWSPSYLAASCGRAPISILRQYIQQQQAESRGLPLKMGQTRRVRRLATPSFFARHTPRSGTQRGPGCRCSDPAP
ncbi:MAG: hypothetical protein ACI9M6_000793 [Hydrogenophaga sp.]